MTMNADDVVKIIEALGGLIIIAGFTYWAFIRKNPYG